MLDAGAFILWTHWKNCFLHNMEKLCNLSEAFMRKHGIVWRLCGDGVESDPHYGVVGVKLV